MRDLRIRLLAIGLLLGVPLVVFAKEPTDFATATTKPTFPPPAKSINGKSIAEMKAAVESQWDTILFEKDGNQIKYVVTLQTDVGNIVIDLWPDVAPNHCRSLIALTNAGFFDGLIFHRVIPGFVIQGGCSKGNGTGGPGYLLRQEFNDRPHVRGVLSMARARAVDTAGSQFFICVDRAASLDRKYTVFGKVREGMEAVDQIVSAPRDSRDRPHQPIKIKKATVTKQ